METSSGGSLTREVPVFSPDELLSKTSRTFALAIPYLPEPTRREVSIAYLLLRIGDTLEENLERIVASVRKHLSELEGGKRSGDTV